MSGKNVVLLGDPGSDHEGFPLTPVISGSPDVMIDGKPVARVGDALAPHSKPKHPPHPRAITAGSFTGSNDVKRRHRPRCGCDNDWQTNQEHHHHAERA